MSLETISLAVRAFRLEVKTFPLECWKSCPQAFFFFSGDLTIHLTPKHNDNDNEKENDNEMIMITIMIMISITITTRRTRMITRTRTRMITRTK